VSPNPNNGKFIIKSDADKAYDLYILDQLDQLIFKEKNLNGNTETGLNNYSKGILCKNKIQRSAKECKINCRVIFRI
jgi:hypothetical protein